MDHRIPIKNGIDTTKKILEMDKNSKIIFTSADNSIKDEALSLGAVAFIKKPFHWETLIRIIKNALDISPKLVQNLKKIKEYKN